MSYRLEFRANGGADTILLVFGHDIFNWWPADDALLDFVHEEPGNPADWEHDPDTIVDHNPAKFGQLIATIEPGGVLCVKEFDLYADRMRFYFGTERGNQYARR